MAIYKLKWEKKERKQQQQRDYLSSGGFSCDTVSSLDTHNVIVRTNLAESRFQVAWVVLAILFVCLFLSLYIAALTAPSLHRNTCLRGNTKPRQTNTSRPHACCLLWLPRSSWKYFLGGTARAGSKLDSVVGLTETWLAVDSSDWQKHGPASGGRVDHSSHGKCAVAFSLLLQVVSSLSSAVPRLCQRRLPVNCADRTTGYEKCSILM